MRSIQFLPSSPYRFQALATLAGAVTIASRSTRRNYSGRYNACDPSANKIATSKECSRFVAEETDIYDDKYLMIHQ
jgi:hypothetical protein